LRLLSWRGGTTTPSPVRCDCSASCDAATPASSRQAKGSEEEKAQNGPGFKKEESSSLIAGIAPGAKLLYPYRECHSEAKPKNLHEM
jgi:hypothetical protein